MVELYVQTINLYSKKNWSVGKKIGEHDWMYIYVYFSGEICNRPLVTGLLGKIFRKAR